MEWIRRLKIWLQDALWRRDATGRSSEMIQPFQELKTTLRQAVASGNRKESERLLQEIRRRYPVPAVDIVPKEAWGLQEDRVVFRTHGTAEMKDAVANVMSTGRSVSSEDEMQLQLVMSHWCAWSPTAASHRNDAWMEFLRRDYPELKGLQPIFDTLIWPAELARYPPGHWLSTTMVVPSCHVNHVLFIQSGGYHHVYSWF